MSDATGGSRILVLGAQGVLGTFVAHALAARGHQITRSGRREDPGKDFVRIDLADGPAVASAVAGADLTVNCAHDPHLAAERAVLSGGGRLLNVANLDLAARRRLAALATPSDQGVVVVHAGLTPGVNSLSAADLLSAHADADEIRLVMTFSLTESGGPQAVGDFAHALMTGRARHPTDRFALNQAYGVRRCAQVADASAGVFGEAAGDRATRVYFCFHERWFHTLLLALNRARVMRLIPRGLFTAGLKVPDELTREPKSDRVEVRREGRLLAARLTCGTGDYRLTVAATVAFAETVAGLPAPPAGVYGAEQITDFERLRPTLEAGGFSFVDLPGE
jgi:hypothetical protein